MKLTDALLGALAEQGGMVSVRGRRYVAIDAIGDHVKLTIRDLAEPEAAAAEMEPEESADEPETELAGE